jgi:hypothetical protein
MTVIRLDAATLAQIKAAGQVELADECGNHIRLRVVPLATWTEPTEEELQAAENDSETYSLDEVWEDIRRREKSR